MEDLNILLFKKNEEEISNDEEILGDENWI